MITSMSSGEYRCDEENPCLNLINCGQNPFDRAGSFMRVHFLGFYHFCSSVSIFYIYYIRKKLGFKFIKTSKILN